MAEGAEETRKRDLLPRPWPWRIFSPTDQWEESMRTGLVVLAAALAAVFCSSASLLQARDLTFQDRVQAQEAIERVYYSHQIGAALPFERAVPRAAIEAKVRRTLKLSGALERIWNAPVTRLALERELQRIARDSRLADQLEEIYRA